MHPQNAPAPPHTYDRLQLGKLYLVPAPLDFGCAVQAPIDDVLPAKTLQSAAQISHWICENAKSARALLKRIHALAPLAQVLQAQQIQELPAAVHKKGDHAVSYDAKALLAPCQQGFDMGLLSEAGMPAVADPGSAVVRAAHDAGIEVVPLVGPTSLILALAASGLNGQNFAFVGYLPVDAAQRSQRIRQLEAAALASGQTQMFIETPYRNQALLQALLQSLKPATRLAVSSGLTLPTARTLSKTVADWQKSKLAPDNATPCLFALGV